jgi:cytochrome oxidase assembly protein ShyY1
MTEPDPGSSDERAATESTEADAAPGDSLPARVSAAASLPDVFPPTLREVMLRPQWIGMLLLCLVVAGVFAWLGQWQLSRAIDTDPPPAGATEVVRPIAEVAEPGAYLPEPLVGQRVSVDGFWMPGNFLIVSSRFNDDVEGYWVTGQLRLAGTDEPTSLAVALGWAPTLDEAQDAVRALDAATSSPVKAPETVTGRLISDEGPVPPPADADPQTMTRMSPAALLGQWTDVEGVDVYRPYLASEKAPAPLVDIASPAPDESSNVNWLNIFYAVEWAIFAGFAFYLWYRLAKDAWEKELEDFEDDHDEADAAARPAAMPDGAAESRG